MKHPNRTTGGLVAAAITAVVALGACSPEERREVRTEGREATKEVRQESREAAGQASAAVDDAAVTTKVKAALLADDQVKGTQINVDTQRGAVSLTGTVDSPAHVKRAEEIARGIEGVQTVKNNLTASANAAPGLVPGTQPAGTSPSATPAPNSTTPSK